MFSTFLLLLRGNLHYFPAEGYFWIPHPRVVRGLIQGQMDHCGESVLRHARQGRKGSGTSELLNSRLQPHWTARGTTRTEISMRPLAVFSPRHVLVASRLTCKAFVEYFMDRVNSYNSSRALDVTCHLWVAGVMILEGRGENA